MKLTILALLAVSAFGQVAERDLSAKAAPVAKEEAKPAQFTMEQRLALSAAALKSIVSDNQAREAMEKAKTDGQAYTAMLQRLLTDVKACAGAVVDLSFSISCPSAK